MRKCALFAVCMVLFSLSSARAEFYRWVDGSGREFFTNDLEKVPHEFRTGVTRVEPDESRVSIGTGPVATVKHARPAGEHKDKYGRGEEYWRKRAAKLYRKLHDLEDDYRLTLKQLGDQEQQGKKTTGKKKKKRSSLENKKLKLEKELVKVRRALEVDLPAEARKADAYPGWIRE